MPTVGTRRSTRVFVPKSMPTMAAEDAPVALVLRSGKRLVLSKPEGKKVEAAGYGSIEWQPLFRSSRDAVEVSNTRGRCWRRDEEVKAEANGQEEEEQARQGGGAEGQDEGACRWDLHADVSESGASAAPEDGTSRYRSPKKKFKVAYSRKRKRHASADRTSSSDSLADQNEDRDWRYGITYERMRWRLSPSAERLVLGGNQVEKNHRLNNTAAGDVVLKEEEEELLLDTYDEDELLSLTVGTENTRIEIVDCTRIFANRVGFLESDLWDGLTDDHVVLLFLVDSSRGTLILDEFSRFLLSVLTGMWRRIKVMKLSVFSRFLLCNAFTPVFAQHGIHLVPLCTQTEQEQEPTSLASAGVCRINGSFVRVPLLTVNYSAVPSYFNYSCASILLKSRFFPTSCPVPKDSGISSTQVMTDNPVPILTTNVTDNTDKINDTPDTSTSVSEPVPLVKDLALVVKIPNGVKVRRSQKRRSSFRSSRTRGSSWKSRKNFLDIPMKNISQVTSTAGADPARQLVEGPIIVEPVESAIDSLLCTGDADDLSAAALLTGKQKWTSLMDFDEPKKSSPKKNDEPKRSSPKKPDETKRSSPKSGDERTKELKATFFDLKQNLDTVTCKTSILVIESDRCWREAVAEVMLEQGDSKEWHLAVKAGNGSTRFVYKATQDVKSSVTNRHTNALIWSADNSWKLEFSDRMDWSIFRELHKECYTRNTQESAVKIIPVPGVREVSDYAEADRSFSRPESYIKAMCNEDERALANSTAEYDMDSGDEEWLQTYNCNSSTGVSESGQPIHLSGETFEKVIYAFEKASYRNLTGLPGLDSAFDLCADMVSKDVVSAVFDYWNQKRKRKRAPLVRVFQEFLSKKGAPGGDTSAKPVLRKKRSFKRQGSQLGRGKPSFFLQVSAQQEQYRRVQEAEKEAQRAEVDAIKMRGRAQILMENADLLTYRAVVALGLARAIQQSGPPDTTFSDFN